MEIRFELDVLEGGGEEGGVEGGVGHGGGRQDGLRPDPG